MEKRVERSPKISIITVVYNGEQYIERTIKSVVGQTYKNIEFVIVDGNSTDRTKEIIEQYASDIQHYISEKDKGIYDAMNKGLRLATGDYVWYINAGDEVFNKQTVEKMFENFKNADVYYGDTELTEEDGSAVSLFKAPKTLAVEKFGHGMVVSHQSMVLKRSLTKEYDLQYKVVADRDWIISTLKKSQKIVYTNSTLSKYLVGGFSAQSFFNNWKEELAIIDKHYGFPILMLNYLYFAKAAARRVIEPYFSKKIIRNKFKKYVRK